MNLKFLFGHWLLMDEKKEDGDGGGGDGDKKKEPPPESDEIKALRAKAAKWDDAEKEKEKNLLDRTRDNQRDQNDKANDTKALERSIEFNLSSKSFLKDNADYLPKEITDIFTTADKERFDSPVQKASEIKAGIVESFFSIQENHDLLTAGQKSDLADYLKLTKNGKQDRAQHVYGNLFEPALERLKAVKKAEQVNRSRNGYSDNSDDAYRKRLIEGSQKHYGVKQNA